MAAPSTLSVGTRILWTAPVAPSTPTQLFSSAGPQTVPSPQTPGPAPVPTGFAVAPPQYPGMVAGSNPLPGLCQSVNGAAPDFAGSTAIVHDQAGKPFLVQMGPNTTTWASNGSPPSQAHWSYVDLSA